MEAELKSVVVPKLHASGFKGSYPHFRRFAASGIHLLTFQHDKWGGGFVIEIACAPSAGITTYWGKAIAPGKVTAWDIHPEGRRRIKPSEGTGTDSWFRYDQEDFNQCAKQALDALPRAEAWWCSMGPLQKA
jgi:hypothetical protein